jgi:hypothetical protein
MRGWIVLVAALAVSATVAPARAAGGGDPPVLRQPVNQTPPSITGTPRLGRTLTASPGEWTGDTPTAFSYQWFRSDDGEFVPIQGATKPTYRITKLETTSSIGREVLVTVEVTATNDVGYGFATPASNVAVHPAPHRPRTSGLAEVDAISVGGRASTIPVLLARHGYRTSYWALQRGRIDVTWALSPGPDARKLAAGHAVIRHRGSVPFKIRLTTWGRHRLRRSHHLTVFTTIDFRPRGGGGDGTGESVELDETTPADDATLVVPMIQTARRVAHPIFF